jgi:hypothetical protein
MSSLYGTLPAFGRRFGPDSVEPNANIHVGCETVSCA